MNEFNLTLSMRVTGSEATLLKMRSFLSFKITHTQASQITLKNGCEDLGIPAI